MTKTTGTLAKRRPRRFPGTLSMFKQCCCCKAEKMIQHFGRSLRNSDGRNGICRDCIGQKDHLPVSRFSRTRAIARRYAIPFTLTLEEFTELSAMPCDYCGDAIKQSGSGLDRLDPKGGYHRDNVAPCCAVCNHMKSNCLDPSEMKLLGPVIAKIRADRTLRSAPPLKSPFQREGHKGRDRNATGTGRKTIRKSDRIPAPKSRMSEYGETLPADAANNVSGKKSE